MARNGTQFSDSHFEKKLLNLKDTQESIQGLSGWCLSHKSDHVQIIKCWLKVIKKGKSELYLPLFYLANDIIQHSKKKGNHDIVSAWEPALKEATPIIRCLREEKVVERVKRIFKIWEEREIYSSYFLKELGSLLTITPPEETKTSVKALDFDNNTLTEKIHLCKTLEEQADGKQRLLNDSKVKITEIDSLRTHVKERHKTNDFFTEFDASVSRMEDYVRALEEEIHERANLVKVLEQGDAFYENQKGEFKQVFTAYKQFGSRVKAVKRKLEEVTPSLPKTQNSSMTSFLNGSAPVLSMEMDIKVPGSYTTHSNIAQRHEGAKSPGEMDLDSRITSFLATGSPGVSRSFLEAPFASDVHTCITKAGRQTDAYTGTQQFQQAPNALLDNTFMTSILGAPPPPPPPLPIAVPPVPVNQDRSSSAVHVTAVQNQQLDSRRKQWENFQPVLNTFPSRIPSWEGPKSEEELSGATHNGDSQTTPYFLQSADQSVRTGKRPIDHRNLISLTGEPEKCLPNETKSIGVKNPIIKEEEISSWLKVLRTREPKDDSTSELDKQVSCLLDSFESPKSSHSSRNQDHEDGHRFKHSRTSTSSRSLSGSKESETRRSGGTSKASSLKSPSARPEETYSSRGSEKRKHSRDDRHSPRSGRSSHSERRRESTSLSSSSRKDTRESSSRHSRSSYQKSSSRW